MACCSRASRWCRSRPSSWSAPLPAATQALEGVRSSSARLAQVLEAPVPVRDPAHPRVRASGRGGLRVRGLRVRHPGQERWALGERRSRPPPGRARGAGRTERRRQDDARLGAAALPALSRLDHARRHRDRRARRRGRPRGGRPRGPGRPRVRHHHRGEPEARAPERQRSRAPARRWRRCACSTGCDRCRRGWRPRSASTAGASPVVSASGWRSPGRCSRTSRC